MKRFSILTALLLLAFLPAGAQEITHHTTSFQGFDREYYLFVPDSMDIHKPLVVMLHGHGGKAKGYRPEMIETARKNGFAVCIPQATISPKSGKAGWNVRYPSQEGMTVDDVTFLRYLVATLQKEHGFSPEATFLTGCSNGGEMCYVFAWLSPSTFTAIASVCGLTMAWLPDENKLSGSHVPFAEIHGTEDRTSEWTGDREGKYGWGPYTSVPEAIDHMVKMNGCKYETETKTQLPEKNGSKVILHRYTGGAAEVRLYEVVGGKHGWSLGEMDTTDEIWSFFKANMKKTAEDFTFKTVKANPVTPVKNQYASGTCWDYATTSLMESEAIRINRIKNEADYPDFSEMFTVSKSYQDRAPKYIHVNGKLTTGPGSLAGDLLQVVKAYGIVPQSAMPGKTELPYLFPMDQAIGDYLKELNKLPAGQIPSDWMDKVKKILDENLGACPETFEYKGKTYTPAQFRDMWKIKADDYMHITSFSHQPFHTDIFVEVPDNWRWDKAWNVPVEEMIADMYKALDKGYTISWDADISEREFQSNGLAYLPEGAPEVTQEIRQQWFESKETVDDHLMHIYGYAVDQNGGKWFLVKNSWGDAGAYKGIWYASEEYVKAKTIEITVHKKAVK